MMRKVLSNLRTIQAYSSYNSTYNTASCDSSKTLPNHAADGTRHHSSYHAVEESLLREISVVGLEKFARWLVELQGLKLETFLFKTANDLTSETALDAVGLDHSKCIKDNFVSCNLSCMCL